MKSLIRVTIAGLTLATTFSLAHAQTVTFANFQQVGADKSFQFLNSGATSTFVTKDTITSNTTIPVNFTFLVDNGSGSMNTPLPANLTITSVVSAPATFGATASQKLQSVQMTFVGTGAVTGNLLTIFGSTGTIGGVLGEATAGLEETNNGGSQIVNYSSAYIDFSGSTQRNYSVALNNIDAPGLANGGNGYLASLQSNATGQFAANGIVPEPSTVFLLGMGALGLCTCRRKKNQHC